MYFDQYGALCNTEQSKYFISERELDTQRRYVFTFRINCMVAKIFSECFQLLITSLNKLRQGLYQREGDAMIQPDAMDLSGVNIFSHFS